MKVNIIRKKLKELGLPTIGDRKVLENRLQRYIILYNAECDKINPRSVSELIKQCAKEENSEIKSQKPLNVCIIICSYHLFRIYTHINVFIFTEIKCQ